MKLGERRIDILARPTINAVGIPRAKVSGRTPAAPNPVPNPAPNPEVIHPQPRTREAVVATAIDLKAKDSNAVAQLRGQTHTRIKELARNTAGTNLGEV
jgi:hypothetical protein